MKIIFFLLSISKKSACFDINYVQLVNAIKHICRALFSNDMLAMTINNIIVNVYLRYSSLAFWVYYTYNIVKHLNALKVYRENFI